MAEVTEKVRAAGRFLKERRRQAQLTIEEVAAKTGLDISDISRMESGRIASPSLDKALRYARALGITPNKLARQYGLWYGADEEEDPRINRLLELARQLPDSDRDRLLDMVEVLAKHAS